VRTPFARIDIGGVPRAVTIDEENGRFEVDLEAGTAVMTFRRTGQVLSILHTEVPESMRGRGIADALARAVLQQAVTRRWTVKPHCPFVSGYIQRHAEYADLLDPSFHS
jgi:predicted GNAT family acetyltransferase